jgi:hypothetical protein
MITVTGVEDSSELSCALLIAGALDKLWPGLAEAPADEEHVRIAASARISGYRVSDIDIAIAAKLRPGRAFTPRRAVKNTEGLRLTGPVAVSSFVAAIEVKDHDPSRTLIEGDAIKVRYENGGPAKWSSATDQNINQVHALKTYFADQHADVFVRRAVIMRGFERVPCSGALPGEFDGAAFLTALCETSPLGSGARASLRASQDAALEKVLAAPVFQELRATALDRRRMDRIITRNPDLEGYLAQMGRKMIRFRGRGGTGKTVMLLQLAWMAFEERAARSLVLTYNRALTSDIRRLLALLNVPSGPEDGGIGVRTVMSFVTAWLSQLGLGPQSPKWLEGEYEKQCVAALALINGGALTPDDVETVKLKDQAQFAFDHIIADEAQDWPQAELELIKALYPSKRLCLADGVDQLIRGPAANWEHGVPETERVVIPLKACLRMKANLAVFANALSERADLNWKVEPHREAAGGRVIILVGALSSRLRDVEEVLAASSDAGNRGVDSLFCVPSGKAGTLTGTLGASHDIWDGTSDAVRGDFPRSADSLRVVHYASCRGLEGWSVFLDRFDVHWSELEAFAPDSHAAAKHAWRQCLIPMTRAMDTLVISLGDTTSTASRTVLAVARSLPDIAEIRERMIG